VIRLEKDGKRAATKFTLEKARPADPSELDVPQIWEWVIETKSYRRLELDLSQKVSDDDVLTRIYSALTERPGMTMSQLQAAVKGDTKRVSELAKTEIEAGRIRNVSTKKSAFRLESPRRPQTSVNPSKPRTPRSSHGASKARYQANNSR
jgi:hypothetical protein